MYEIGILGVGKMGGSILEGMLTNDLYSKKDMLLMVHSKDKYEDYKDDGFNVTFDPADLFYSCKTIIVAIKPQMFKEVLTGAQKYDFDRRSIISIAAGVKIEKLLEYFKNATIIRAMPNTPALISSAVTTVCFNNDNEYVTSAINIFNSIGKTYKVKEEEMNQTLPLNGSMPAYAYLFMKAFIDAAVKQGIDEETAKGLCANSVISSAKMVLSTSETIDTLIKNVCSKGGTTLAGLDKLYENNFEKAVEECYNACVNRSIELGK